MLRDESINDEVRKNKLKQLDSGVTWRYLIRNYMPQLRAATWECTWAEVITPLPDLDSINVSPSLVSHQVSPIKPLSITVPHYPSHSEESSSKAIVSVNTNLLCDLLAVPNAGVEFYLGKRWSLDVNWQYAWWKNDPASWYWRIYGGELVVRKWFGKRSKTNPLIGHHIGLYGQYITYDFAFGGSGQIGGKPGGTLWDKANFGVGVEYGYSIPIADRLNLDFNIGIGYLGGEYQEYIPQDDCYVWQATKYRHYFGPAKAEISLVWVLGKGYSNNVRKGGMR